MRGLNFEVDVSVSRKTAELCLKMVEIYMRDNLMQLKMYEDSDNVRLEFVEGDNHGSI